MSREPGAARAAWVVGAAGLIVAAVLVLAALGPDARGAMRETAAVLASADAERIHGWFADRGRLATVGIVLAMLLQPVLVVVPSVGMMVVAVLGFGPVLGGLLAWGGSLGAALLAYAVGRWLAPVTVQRMLGRERERELERYIERYGAWAVLAFRVSPLLSTDAISFAAGLLGMRLRPYLGASALGFAPLAALAAWLGSSFADLGWALAAASAASVALLALGIGIDRLRTRERSNRSSGEDFGGT